MFRTTSHFQDPKMDQTKPLQESLMTKRERQTKEFKNYHLEQQNKRPTLDLSPVVYVTVNQIQQSLPTRALIVLLDSGISHTMIKKDSLLHGMTVTTTPARRTTTTNGVFATNSNVALKIVKFPKFGNHYIDQLSADVFDSPTCHYDIILGCNLLKLMGACCIDFKSERCNVGETVCDLHSDHLFLIAQNLVLDRGEHESCHLLFFPRTAGRYFISLAENISNPG